MATLLDEPTGWSKMSIFDKRALPKEFLGGSDEEQRIGPADELGPGTVTGVGDYAVGNADGRYFAVSRSCRHLAGDLAKGTIDAEGCIVCPLHGARYDVKTGEMVRGPQGLYARLPGLGAAFKALTKVVPLRRREVDERDGILYLK